MKWIRIFDSEKKTFENLEENKTFTISINQLRICMVRNGSKISAFKAQCPHSGASLSDGFVNDYNEIVCPLHGYRFNLLDGRENSGKNCELFMFPTEFREDGFYLGIR